jgi:hypothetical protein
MMRIHILILITFLISACGSSSSDDKEDLATQPTPPDFTIETDISSEYDIFDRKIMVFGISVYAVSGVEEARLVHAATILAQYLDNDENGIVDNAEVVATLIDEKSFLAMWKNEDDLEDFQEPAGTVYQDLGSDETNIAWHQDHTGDFDASLEEVLHLITFVGYAQTYPDVFAEEIGSTIAIAMDVARGGQYLLPPEQYPENSWYHYDDESCEYQCMVTEYFYWGLTSILGAQENRLASIEGEWELNTSAKVESEDPDLFNLLTDSKYHLPTILPDGTYNPSVN